MVEKEIPTERGHPHDDDTSHQRHKDRRKPREEMDRKPTEKMSELRGSDPFD